MKRRLIMLSAVPALALAGACGGGDKGPTGPDGGDDVDTWQMVAVGRAGLPADAQPEDCSVTRFYSGKLDLTENGWRLRIQVHTNDGDWGYEDEGQYQADGNSGWFKSNISGSTYQAMYDGNDLTITYDWCYDGRPDVQLVFE